MDPEHIDDVLYCVRVDEKEELDQTLQTLSQHYKCTPGEILVRSLSPGSSNTVLHYSSANGLEDMTSSILKLVSPNDLVKFINRSNSHGNTALHWASLNGHLAVVKLLVEAGADMWLKNSAGHLAMFEAERAEKNDVVQYLLQTGGKEVERTGNETEEDGEVTEDGSSTAHGA